MEQRKNNNTKQCEKKPENWAEYKELHLFDNISSFFIHFIDFNVTSGNNRLHYFLFAHVSVLHDSKYSLKSIQLY